MWQVSLRNLRDLRIPCHRWPALICLYTSQTGLRAVISIRFACCRRSVMKQVDPQVELTGHTDTVSPQHAINQSSTLTSLTFAIC